MMLNQLGARVFGYALNQDCTDSIYRTGNVSSMLSGEVIGDIRNSRAVKESLSKFEPDLILHLAAQPLVRLSYEAPLETYSVNVLGTANLLEAVRDAPSVSAVVIVTSDKCYENEDRDLAYTEEDRLGGHDPYSSSKACQELVAQCFRDSYLKASGVSVATARAGNVLGGGDWSEDRLIPDYFRALRSGSSMKIRSLDASRPWQHVLDPLYGYLLLAERLYESPKYTGSWNFGPDIKNSTSVGQLISAVECRTKRKIKFSQVDIGSKKEAKLLKLDIAKAKTKLNWRPKLGLDETLDLTCNWYLAQMRGIDMRDFSLKQAEGYLEKVAH